MEDLITDHVPGEPSASPLFRDEASVGDDQPSTAPPAGEDDGAPANKAGTSTIADQVKQKLTGVLAGQKDAAADALKQVADTVHRSGEQFQGQQDWIASAVEHGATELDALATALREKELGDLAGQVRSFARRRPAIFVGAAFAAGFVIARIGRIVVSDLSRDDLPRMPEVGDAQQ